MSILSFEALCLEDDNRPSLTQHKDWEDESDKDLESDENNKEMTIAEVYIQACKLVGVVPVSYFIRNLDSPTMSLIHHGLGPLGCKALSIALVTDMQIKTLELGDNHIQAKGAKYLAEIHLWVRANIFRLLLDFRMTFFHIRSMQGLMSWTLATMSFVLKEGNTWDSCWVNK
uniref:Uncharacterized protein n=1 Tax=Gouania willdenowi TaxID=441366 RepID=A0A8C5E0K4_GOUWI